MITFTKTPRINLLLDLLLNTPLMKLDLRLQLGFEIVF